MLDTAEKNRILDLVYAPTGVVGRIALISGSLVTTAATVNDTTDVWTTTNSDPKYLTGSRIRLTTDGTFPTVSAGDPINNGIDYFLIRVTANTFKIARTLADAIANTAINFTSVGTGTHSFVEQQLTINDSLEIIVNKELTHAAYARHQLNSIGAASLGYKTIVWAITVPSGGDILSYRHKLLIIGGSDTIGNTTGTKNHFFTMLSENTINPGQSATLAVRLELANP